MNLLRSLLRTSYHLTKRTGFSAYLHKLIMRKGKKITLTYPDDPEVKVYGLERRKRIHEQKLGLFGKTWVEFMLVREIKISHIS